MSLLCVKRALFVRLGFMGDKIVVILGPTATGKTDLATKLCQRFGGEIISVDSRQAYQEMEIGTGKKCQMSNVKCQNSVPIHLYDTVKPDRQLNAFEYSRQAWEKIIEIRSREKVPFLVGGTGFYLEVILGFRQLAGFGVDQELRAGLTGLSDLQLASRLGDLDPVGLKTIDVHNKYRLMRAVEVAVAKTRGSDLKIGSDPGEQTQTNLCSLLIGLTAENPRLYEMADERVDRMISQGLPEEVRRLAKKYSWTAPGLKTLGYREFKPCFEAGVSLSEVTQKVKFHTHSYIRRQKTYFKKYFALASWFDISKPGFEKDVAKEVKSFLRDS